MKNFKTLLCLFIISCCSFATAHASEAQGKPTAQVSDASSNAVYDAVYSTLRKTDNRLPGSAGYLAAQQQLLSVLEQAGIAHGVQTYNTAVPKTIKCELKVGAKLMSGIHPVQPNQFATTSTSGKALSGPLQYLGKATNESIDGKTIKGSIVLVDIDTKITPLLFNLGALAVIYVGTEHASQWDMQFNGIEQPIHLPRAYISRADAEQQGLLSETNQDSSIEMVTQWTSVVASNIWAKLPANVHNEKLQDILYLTATYDTFGFVPDYDPELRDAANVALLAQTVVNLKAQDRSRDVIVAFLGSHYSAQEGARYVHWAAENSYNNRSHIASPYFSKRKTQYEGELSYYAKMLSLLNTPNFILKTDNPVHRDAKKAYRRVLDQIIGDLNFEIRGVSLDAAHAARQFKDDPKDLASDALSKKLSAQEKQLRLKKDSWTNLLGDLMQASASAAAIVPEERMPLYQEALQQATGKIENTIKDLHLLIEHNASNQKLADQFGAQRILMQLSFDFSSDHKPWLHNFTGDHSSLYVYGTIGLGFLNSHINLLNKIYDSVNAGEKDAPLFKYLHSVVKPESLCTPYKRSQAGLTALMLGIYGYNLCSVGDALNDDNMPVRKDASLKGLLHSIPAYLLAITNTADNSLKAGHAGERFKPDPRLVYTANEGTREGLHAEDYVKGSTDTAGESSYALMTVHYPNMLPNRQPGNTNYILGLTDARGYLISPNMARMTRYQPAAIAYGFDANGAINKIGTIQLNKNTLLRMFYCSGGGTFVPVFPINYEKFTTSDYYKGDNDSALPAPTTFKFEDAHSLGLYADHNDAIKIINSSGIRILGSTKEKPIGVGVQADAQSLLNMDPLLQTSEDLVALNESRLDNLRSKNIILDDVETLHANAKDHLAQALEDQAEQHHNLALSQSLYASTLANHAYVPLVATTNDMIKAVVILLILSIPFAFSLERLFCGFTTIYKQVSGFMGFFLLTFVLLYFAHPAFSVASSPSIIFLAFIIIIMSGMVIWIIMSKFKREILALQGLQTSSHGGGGSNNTALASVVIGISTMRNRPLKTFLTAFTIILLTFTILVFASFGSKIGVSESYIGQDASPERIEVRRNAYMELPQQIQDSITAVHKQHYQIYKRGAYYPYPYDGPLENRECVLYLPKQNTSMVMVAALGLDPAERSVNPAIDKIYPTAPQTTATDTASKTDTTHAANTAEAIKAKTATTTFAHPMYLDESVQTYLKLTLGDPIVLNGKQFTYAGNFNRNQVKAVSYLDDMKLVPPDFKATKDEDKDLSSASSESLGSLLAQIDTSSFRWVPVDSLALINYDDLSDIRGFNNAMILYPHEDIDVDQDAERLAEVFDAPVYAKSKDGIKRFFYTESFDSSGIGDILVPLLLGGLIIFSSLLGSIVDREREIFTFSALGLAPPNVAALFFAESAVYAVIGGLGGYIISQLVAVFLAYLSDLGIFQAPDMNFSSLSSTYTILLVMATVMLSTIYPALKAGKSANPGIARKWQMPTPEGDRLSFVFPFTVGCHDLGGILSFITEHFESHRDASLGKFAAADVHMRAVDAINYTVDAKVSLAPFDLGIFQHFTLASRPSDIPNILEITVELERLSGSPSSWLRSNRNFLDDLRNQFLIWRSLPAETIAHYTEKAKEQKHAEQEQADA